MFKSTEDNIESFYFRSMVIRTILFFLEINTGRPFINKVKQNSQKVKGSRPKYQNFCFWAFFFIMKIQHMSFYDNFYDIIKTDV